MDLFLLHRCCCFVYSFVVCLFRLIFWFGWFCRFVDFIGVFRFNGFDGDVFVGFMLLLVVLLDSVLLHSCCCFVNLLSLFVGVAGLLILLGFLALTLSTLLISLVSSPFFVCGFRLSCSCFIDVDLLGRRFLGFVGHVGLVGPAGLLMFFVFFL